MHLPAVASRAHEAFAGILDRPAGQDSQLMADAGLFQFARRTPFCVTSNRTYASAPCL